MGKTRGGLAYTLQELLSRGEAVVRVGYKTNQAHLFLPGKECGEYSVWQGKAADWSRSLVVAQPDLFVLIDPPESGDCNDSAPCLVIKYASNNQKHYHNLHKDGALLVTGAPTEDELVAMMPELWGAESAFRWQRFRSLQDTEAEVRKRARIVGCAPRYVFSAAKFRDELDLAKQQANAFAREMEGQPKRLLAHILGECTNAEGHPSSVSSRLFELEPEEPGFVAPWTARRRASVKLKKTAVHLMSSQLEAAISAYTGQEWFLFEQFVQDVLEHGVHSTPQLPRARAYPRPASLRETYRLMMRMMHTRSEDARPLYLCTSQNFPVVDFVLSVPSSLGRADVDLPSTISATPIVQEWWNAKVGSSTPEMSSTAFVTLMKGLGLIDCKGRVTEKCGTMMVKLRFVRSAARRPTRESFSFVNTHTTGTEPDFETTRQLFEQFVDVECVHAPDWIAAWRKSTLESLTRLEGEIADYARE